MDDATDSPYRGAEIVAVILDREGPTVEMQIKLFFPDRPEGLTVPLRFTQVSHLHLAGLTERNVLVDLHSNLAADGRLDVTLEASSGLSCSLRCARIIASTHPPLPGE